MSSKGAKDEVNPPNGLRKDVGGCYRTQSHRQLEEGGIEIKCPPHPPKRYGMQVWAQEAEERHSDKAKLK